MYRSQSQQQIARVSYQNISTRINRLRTSTSPHSSLSKPLPYTNPSINLYQPVYPPTRPPSCYRSNLKVQDGGIFGVDISNQAGRVAKNIGIKKYNQRHLKETLNRNAYEKQNDQYSFKQSYQGLAGNINNQRLTNSPKYQNSPEEIIRPSTGYSIKLYDYIQQNNNHQKVYQNQSKLLMPGKIYTIQQLSLLI